MNELLLALDLGTTNAKAAVYDLQGDRLADAAVSYPTYYPQAGWAEQRPAEWRTALSTALRQVVGVLGERTSDLAGMGLSAHGSGVVLIDDRGTPLIETVPTWQDERCAAQGRWLYEKLGYLWSGIGAPLHNFPAKLLWAQQHFPHAAKQARYALSVKDYLAHWLTGAAATEPSSGPGAAQWEAEVIAMCGWSLDRLPPVAAPTAVVGGLRTEIAGEIGLPAGLPVVIGLNDGASAALAMGAIRSGDTTITLSTNGVVRVLVEAQLPADVRLDHALFNWLYLTPLWMAGGQTKAGASTLDWFGGMIAGSSAHKPAELLETLLAEAAVVPAGSRGVRFLPYLMGRGSPHSNPLATGTFSGLTAATTRGEMVRAVLEGTTFALREIVDDFAQLGYPPQQLRLSGGGGRSALWRQIAADTLAQPLHYYESDSTLGAAMITAAALGLHRDFPTAVQAMVRATSTTLPDPNNVSAMVELGESYRRLRDTLFPPPARPDHTA